MVDRIADRSDACGNSARAPGSERLVADRPTGPGPRLDAIEPPSPPASAPLPAFPGA